LAVGTRLSGCCGRREVTVSRYSNLVRILQGAVLISVHAQVGGHKKITRVLVPFGLKIYGHGKYI